jgi:hypothetical protein
LTAELAAPIYIMPPIITRLLRLRIRRTILLRPLSMMVYLLSEICFEFIKHVIGNNTIHNTDIPKSQLIHNSLSRPYG